MAEVNFSEDEIKKAIALDEAKRTVQAKLEAEKAAKVATDRAAKLDAENKAREAARSKKISETLKKINAEADEFYDKQIVATILPFTEKGGNVVPAMVIKHGFKKVAEGDKMVEKLALTFLVFSVEAAQPYKAEVLY